MVKLVIISILCAIIVLYLKNINSELYVIALFVSGLIIFSFSFPYVDEIVSFFEKIVSLSGIERTYFKIIFKIIAMGYIVEFGAGVINDLGLSSLSDKLVFVGKIIILTISMPIFYAIINILSELF